MKVQSPKRTHLMGVGGAHMSAIAQILLRRGHWVSGCDLNPSHVTERLVSLGVHFYQGHSPDHLKAVDQLVATAAVRTENLELMAAREIGLPIMSRAEMVASLMEGRSSVCVTGSHGKTTTTSLIAYLLWRSGLDPTYLIGGDMVNLGGNAAAGEGEHVVVEADEYAAAFLNYRPRLAVITNVEPDHLDYYGTFERLVEAFRQFLSQVAVGGVIVACMDSPVLRSLIDEGWPVMVRRYALNAQAEWQAEEIEPADVGGHIFNVTREGRVLGRFETPLPGLHNVANCLAGIAAGQALGLTLEQMQTAVGEFKGVERRFQRIGEAAGVTVMDDYAHHPSEVRATLSAAAERFAGRRLVCLFQPHTYSRSKYLKDEFITCFEGAGLLLITETYAAREEAGAGMSAQELAEVIDRPKARYAGGLDEAVRVALSLLQEGDVFFTIGAGDVNRAGLTVLEGLAKR